LDRYWSTLYASNPEKKAHFLQNCFLVFDPEGKLAGSCLYYKAYGNNVPDKRDGEKILARKDYPGEVSTIQCLTVEEKHRRKGIGKALLARCMAQVPPEAYPVYLCTHSRNAPAIGMYLKDFHFRFVTGDYNGPTEKRPWGQNFTRAKDIICKSLNDLMPAALGSWQEQPEVSQLFAKILKENDRTEL
jgi:ribosomal protein S18 acetylase RimI-like enzyme